MLNLTLLTLTLVTSQLLEMEVSQAVEEYLLQLNLASIPYVIEVSDQVPEGAAVLHWVEAGEDNAIFFFHRGLFLELSRRERRVLIAHEVSHLAPECLLLGRRIYRELCADVISLQLVPVNDLTAMLAKSIVMSSYSFVQKEFSYRLAMIQEYSVASRVLEQENARLRRFTLEYLERLDCE